MKDLIPIPTLLGVSMPLRYDSEKRVAVDDDTSVEIKHSAKPGVVSRDSYARYSRGGFELFVPYYYFNKDVLDKTAFGLRHARRPYKAIIPESPIEFYNFSSFFLRLNGEKASPNDYRRFLNELGHGLMICFKANGDWDEFLAPYEFEIMNWKEANIYVSKFPSE